MKRWPAAAFLAAVAWSLAPVDGVSAHAGLVASVPAASAVLSESPERILLDFDESVESAGASIELFDQSGTRVALGAASRTDGDDSVIVADTPDLGNGTYAVVWRIVSTDGHVVDGAFSFQIGTLGAGDGGALLDKVGGGLGAARTVRWAYGLARGTGYSGVALLLGGGLLLLWSDGAQRRRRRPMWLLRGGAITAVVGTAGGFGLYAVTVVSGGLGDAFDPDAWSTAFDTRTGRMLAVRLASVLLLGALVATWRHATTEWWRPIALLAAVATVVTFPAGGHPGALAVAPLWIAVGTLHIGGALLWVGGLLMLAGTGVTAAHRFSLVSTIAVPVVVVTGVVQTLKLVDDPGDLTATSWGRVLLVKIAVVVVALSVAGVSRWIVIHAGGVTLRRTVVTEGVLGLAVLGLAAGLVALPPRPIEAGEVFSTTLAEAGLIADVTVTPGRTGLNDIHVVLTPPGGSIQPVVGMSARMSLPEKAIPASPVTIEADGPNHYTGRITLAFSGDWTLELIVEPSAGSTLLLKTTVPVP